MLRPGNGAVPPGRWFQTREGLLADIRPSAGSMAGTHSGQDAQGEGGKPTRMYLLARSTQDVWPGNFVFGDNAV